MRSPHTAQTVAIEHRIATDHVEPAVAGLDDLDAVEGITVDWFQELHRGHGAPIGRQHLETVFLEETGEVGVEGVAQLEFSQSRFNRRFPDRGQADAAIPRLVLQNVFGSAAEASCAFEKSDPSVRIDQISHMYSLNSSRGSSKSGAI